MSDMNLKSTAKTFYPNKLKLHLNGMIWDNSFKSTITNSFDLFRWKEFKHHFIYWVKNTYLP